MNRKKKEKVMTLQETLGLERRDEPVTLGIPLPPGEIRASDHLALVDERGTSVSLQTAPLAYWPDGSLKWLLADFFASVPSRGKACYRVVPSEEPVRPAESGIGIHPGKDCWTIDTGNGEFLLDARQFRPFTAVRQAERQILQPGLSTCRLTMEDGTEGTPMVEEIRVERTGPLRATIFVRGSFRGVGNHSPVFFSRLHFFRKRSLVKIEFTLRNPDAARHAGGLWDLGDPGSLFFKELALHLALPLEGHPEVFLSPEAGKDPLPGLGKDDVSIYQESSGGESWRSPTHQNRHGEIPFHLKGYEIRTGETTVDRGLRAVPVIWVGDGEKGISTAMTSFWQEFPKAYAVDREKLSIGLFPGRFPEAFELQGGEQKTHCLYVDFSASREALAWVREPLIPAAAPEVYLDAGVFPDLPLPGGPERKRHTALVGNASSLADVFLAGREVIDEYGWRNFGEVYADHEAVYHQGDAPFISHYNNQYDLVLGSYREFMTTGDPVWRRVAADLARHVIDIDIYHTQQDREEYNHGLFWHTDHYLEAETATHRSFSKVHLEMKDPRFCGGGPGPEHCYTSGLATHYFLTGDEAAKEAVLGLADWSCRVLSRPKTLLGSLNQAKKSFAVLKSSREGNAKKRVFPKYPLTRATGNTVTACLDAFELTADERYLKAAEEFIRGTVHPGDQVGNRNLLNAEMAWSYTVFLSALGRYLDGKCRRHEIDGAFEYGRESLLTYARWMATHEYPFLDHPEILEYPNETWAAQDLRKSVVLYYAARFSNGDWRNQFLGKSAFFSDAGWRELLNRETSRLARPVVLVLQNSWVESRLAAGLPAWEPAGEETKGFGTPTPLISASAVVTRFAKDLVGAMQSTTWRKELSWLKARLR